MFDSIHKQLIHGCNSIFNEIRQLSLAPGDAGSLWVPMREVPMLLRNVTINIPNKGYMLISLQFLGAVLGDRDHIVFPVERTIHYT